MKITKYEHSCMVLEDQGKKLIIDPGGFTASFGDIADVLAVIVTHVHPDHFNPEHLATIFAANPDAQFFTTTEVAEQANRAQTKVVQAGEEATVGPFKLRFGGEMHQVIHKTLPYPHNTTVFVNDTFYYTGDSYVMPDKPVKILAAAGNAPWMKVADSMDFVAAVKPDQYLPVHDGLLSENGHKVYYFALQKACDDNGIKFAPLKPGESLEA